MKSRTKILIVVASIASGIFPLQASATTKAMPDSARFQPTDQSLSQYQYPTWFRDAKFGIWAHWGPQAVPRHGDWYAREMYVEGSDDYNDHLKRYGHPSVSGYKDIIPLWKAERWDPDKLMKLYKRVGARYFVSMGSHHDNFFLWNSKLHKWNSVNMGPHRDVVGEWQKAAKKEGLPFGVSEHLAASFTWFQTAHGADTKGAYKGVPYDGNDSRFDDLYHKRAFFGDNGWMSVNPTYQKEWYNNITELIDNYHPDLLYSDSQVPFGNEVGRAMIAHFYNQSLDKDGKPTVVYTCKEDSKGRFVRDLERGINDGISPYPWQTDTSIGDWYYRTGQKYMTANEVVQMLVDIVSKNGNLLLNVVQTPEGDLEPDVMNILEGIASWIKTNGVAIYGSRPWLVFGEGPSIKAKQEKSVFGGLRDIRKYEPGDLRFTVKGKVLYAFAMEHPTGDITIESIPASAKVKSVNMLGMKNSLKWKQQADGKLIIEQPKKYPDYPTVVFEVRLNGNFQNNASNN
jgi:alpha-L-fucosidase